MTGGHERVEAARLGWFHVRSVPWSTARSAIRGAEVRSTSPARSLRSRPSSNCLKPAPTSTSPGPWHLGPWRKNEPPAAWRGCQYVPGQATRRPAGLPDTAAGPGRRDIRSSDAAGDRQARGRPRTARNVACPHVGPRNGSRSTKARLLHSVRIGGYSPSSGRKPEPRIGVSDQVHRVADHAVVPARSRTGHPVSASRSRRAGHRRDDGAHTGGRVERERCRAGDAFWQFATRAVSASADSPLELSRRAGGRTGHRAGDCGSRTTSACSHAFGAKTARSLCSPAC